MAYLLSTANSPQSTSLSAIGLTFALAMCLLLLILPRHLVLLPVVLTACYMTCGQQVVVAGLHFTILRILVALAFIRIITRQEYRSYKWHRLDTFISLWSLSSIIFFTLLWGSTAATINRMGVASDTAGLYFAFRFLVRDMDDVKMAFKLFAVLMLPLAFCMLLERMAGGRNPFYALGGVLEYSEIRRGVVRCQGPFKHPILAGTFGAVWAPLFIGFWRYDPSSRVLAVVGLVASTTITILSGSSGPIMTYVFGLIATGMWVMRRYMQVVRWMLLLLFITLHFVMNDPVWFIFARVNILSGSTGWHRSNLIDQTIRHFGDWWLLGTKDVGKWGVWAGDITNQYILEGVNGGLVTALLFLTMVIIAYSTVGKAMKAKCDNPKRLRTLIWAIGCVLFAHSMTFLSVSYFDQNVVNFYLALTMITIPWPGTEQVARPSAKQTVAVRGTGMLGRTGKLPGWSPQPLYTRD